MSATDNAQRQLIRRAIDSIADGSAGQAAHLEQERRRALELQAELQAGPQLRPGLLSEAESVAENYLRQVGRLAPNETLIGNMSVRVHGTDGRPIQVSVPRWETMEWLQERIGGGGLIMNGRPVAKDKPLFDLWLRNQLGSLTVANGSQPRVQSTVRNAGG
ncbi:hypothetical protein BOX15_Mlig027467g1 [Macrostomum lignano]|uniref:Uncharacterized protein n=1 Tax=Macrostomum lignano TaxID=282301 RepID=A0A267EB97_9PLAT|nr:hypothetical protein BOX15_Mlig027467g1 [Macrostomum lignano]